MCEIKKVELKKPVAIMPIAAEDRDAVAAKIQPALDEAQKSARVRIIDISDMEYAIEKAENIISGAG